MNEYENRWALPDRHSAILWGKARNRQSIKVVLDILGDYANDEPTASKATSDHLDLLKLLATERMFAAMSVKVSALGFTFDRDACLLNLLSIAKEASLRGIGFEIDMEGRATVDFALDATRAVAETRYPVTVALQAYLDRTAKDIESMVKNGIRVRLVKGAYAGDAQDFEDIQGRFKNLMRVLADSGQDFCIGTHDPSS